MLKVNLKATLFLQGLIILLIISCKKDVSVNPDLGYEYFPATVGKYVVYDVDSIVHNDFTSTTDTFKYQIKETIESIFLDNSNRQTLRIERCKKTYNDTIPYSAIPWTIEKIWSANRTTTTAEKVEENQRFVKLIFPIKKEGKWNGNAFNTNGEWIYKYTDIDVPQTFSNLSFDSTLVVTQIDEENLIEKKYYIEVYAKNVGMIYKQVIDVQSNSSNFFLPIMTRITSGIEYKMTINSYGSN